MKLKKGDSINELTLPSVDGSTFNLETIKGKKAMISFYRYSSCPFCHLRINEIISKKSEFGDNFVPIAIFDCDFDDLVKNSKKHDGEITILCDDDRKGIIAEGTLQNFPIAAAVASLLGLNIITIVALSYFLISSIFVGFYAVYKSRS